MKKGVCVGLCVESSFRYYRFMPGIMLLSLQKPAYVSVLGTIRESIVSGAECGPPSISASKRCHLSH